MYPGTKQKLKVYNHASIDGSSVTDAIHSFSVVEDLSCDWLNTQLVVIVDYRVRLSIVNSLGMDHRFCI